MTNAIDPNYVSERERERVATEFGKLLRDTLPVYVLKALEDVGKARRREDSAEQEHRDASEKLRRATHSERVAAVALTNARAQRRDAEVALTQAIAEAVTPKETKSNG